MDRLRKVLIYADIERVKMNTVVYNVNVNQGIKH